MDRDLSFPVVQYNSNVADNYQLIILFINLLLIFILFIYNYTPQ